MKTAVYGRMEQGRCAELDMGYIGCNADVLDLADDRCSGRRMCDITVPDLTFESTKPCLELKSYLRASYTCIKGIIIIIIISRMCTLWTCKSTTTLLAFSCTFPIDAHTV